MQPSPAPLFTCQTSPSPGPMGRSHARVRASPTSANIGTPMRITTHPRLHLDHEFVIGRPGRMLQCNMTRLYMGVPQPSRWTRGGYPRRDRGHARLESPCANFLWPWPPPVRKCHGTWASSQNPLTHLPGGCRILAGTPATAPGHGRIVPTALPGTVRLAWICRST